MSRLAVLLLVALTTLTAASRCYPKCNFVFCGATYVYDLPYADKSFTGGICRRNGDRIGVVNTGEARIYADGKFTRISEYYPDGLAQKFSPHFFKGIYIPTVKYEAEGGKLVPEKVDSHYSGVARETYQTNQRRFINNKCIILPLRSWQIVKSNVVIGNAYRGRDNLHDCVAFETLLQEEAPAPAAAAAPSPSSGPLPVSAPDTVEEIPDIVNVQTEMDI